MVLELTFGLMVNQPDEFGVYPYWDNSQLPLNILGQAWLVNDIFIGIAAVVYIWGVWPLVNKGLAKLSMKTANIIFGIIAGLFVVACLFSYIPIWMNILNGIA